MIMKLVSLLDNVPKIVLTEAKARIEHPEDMIFDGGLDGLINSLHILQATAKNPTSLSIKADGSPALIFGWIGDDFVLTDKAGFSTKKYNGLTTSSPAIEQMIMSRKVPMNTPEEVANRRSYAEKIANLYPILREAVPKSFRGFVQGDLMWTGIPPIVHGAYEFKPNKILYRVPVNSELGKKIAKSRMGIVIHSVFLNRDDPEPTALRNVKKLGFKEQNGLVILPLDISAQSLSIDNSDNDSLQSIIKEDGMAINDFFDHHGLSENGIKSLPSLMKSFLAFKASQGDSKMNDLSIEFKNWIESTANGKISSKMMTRILIWITGHRKGYDAIWSSVEKIVDIKLKLKSQIDNYVGKTISASLRNKSGHEGFVSVTPTGTIKLVNRAEFMKNTESSSPITEDEEQNTRVVWSFVRANPPTKGHQLVVSKVAKLAADGCDYWIFLSHSQDTKKNPLDWQTKLDFVKRIMPKYASHIYDQDDIKTPVQAADWLYAHGYRVMTLVCGSDRIESMTTMLNSWNSEKIRSKYGREPVTISIVSAGDRDPDATGLKGISGTKARDAVEKNNMAEFEKSTGLTGDLAKELFAAVKSNTGLHGLAKTVHELKEDSVPLAHFDGTIVKLKMEKTCANKLSDWCKSKKIPCIPEDELHITVLYSKNPVPHLMSLNENKVTVTAKIKDWKVLGEKALTLILDSPTVVMFHNSLKKQGGTHGFKEYIVHTSVCYDWTGEYTPNNIPPFPLVFDTIIVEAIDPNWSK